MSNRRTHSPEFKAKVAMEAISGRKTRQQIAADHAVHPIQVSQWKTQVLEGASELFRRYRTALLSARGACVEHLLMVYSALWFMGHAASERVAFQSPFGGDSAGPDRGCCLNDCWLAESSFSGRGWLILKTCGCFQLRGGRLQRRGFS